MRILFAFAILLLFASCRKDSIYNTSNSLEGEWKLVTITDKSSGITYFRPSGSLGDAIIKFAGNHFSGHTLKNTISDGSYNLQNTTEITFGGFIMTKIAEDDWGGKFITVLHSCYLQSVSPCMPSKISFQGNKLMIESPLRYDLSFVRN